MKKPSEIFEEHINSLIEYVSEIKDKSKEISNRIEKSEIYSEQEMLTTLRHVYNEIFDDLCSLIKNTMQSAMQSKINGDNVSDTSRIDE
jgi:hypothetical protein